VLLELLGLRCGHPQNQDARAVPDQAVREEMLQGVQAETGVRGAEEVLQVDHVHHRVHQAPVATQGVRQGPEICEALQDVQDRRCGDALCERVPQSVHGGEEEVRLRAPVPPPQILCQARMPQAGNAGHVGQAGRLRVAQRQVYREDDGGPPDKEVRSHQSKH